MARVRARSSLQSLLLHLPLRGPVICRVYSCTLLPPPKHTPAPSFTRGCYSSICERTTPVSAPRILLLLLLLLLLLSILLLLLLLRACHSSICERTAPVAAARAYASPARPLLYSF